MYAHLFKCISIRKWFTELVNFVHSNLHLCYFCNEFWCIAWVYRDCIIWSLYVLWIGAYGVALLFDRQGVSITNFFIGIVVAIIISAIVSYIIGLLSLRLKSHFYAMLTLAISQLFFVLAEKWRGLTHGGWFTFGVPDVFRDRFTFYYVTLICLLIIFVLLRLFTKSSIGKVLKAISQMSNVLKH